MAAEVGSAHRWCGFGFAASHPTAKPNLTLPMPFEAKLKISVE
jgi:hypothetical protein